jgi:hypothetical protein
MRLLLLGALGPYPERLHSFVEEGHQVWFVSTLFLPPQEQLHGVKACHLWDLGAAPTDAVEKLAQLIERERIDVVYSLLNVWDGSNHPTALLLQRGCSAPVVRHYKEHYMAPSEDERTCLQQSDGVIFINGESRDYFSTCYSLPERTACLDADSLPRRYLAGALQPKLSAGDGRPHLLIAGRATEDGGRYDYRDLILDLAQRKAHVHLYGQFQRMDANGHYKPSHEVEELYRGLGAGDCFHIHALIPPSRFVEEWSCYDAGLLHVPRPDDPFSALNMPNRYSAYIAAGLPVALCAGHMPAMQRHLEAMNAAVVYGDLSELVGRLPDQNATAGAMNSREAVTFEAVFPELVNFLQSCRR